DLAPRLLALAQALSVTERQLHGSLLNMRRVVSRICGALFRASLKDGYTKGMPEYMLKLG
ncbi:hypothetical protein V2H26_20215, partial [Xanthomonas euvesicatoria]|uniref:hypothetical protein n=1 Tax=Xanthomonas citri TaxID=346 RepID=UPI002ED71784|nr:hypothetical protein [Xanthomonas euvesicatoria]